MNKWMDTFNTWTGYLFAAALGALLMYMLDPAMGNRRRAITRDQTLARVHGVGDTVTGYSKHLTNKAKGLTHEITTPFHKTHEQTEYTYQPDGTHQVHTIA